MSKTFLKTSNFYLTQDEMDRLDRLRGYVPRSRIGALAVRRFLDDVESGKVELNKPEPGEVIPIPGRRTNGDRDKER